MAHHFLLPIATILVTLLFLSPTTTASDSPVLDVDGNPLEVGSQYYVLTAGWGAAGRGGLTHASRPLDLCPTYVAQIPWWTDNGIPVSFHPSDSSQKQITQGDDVNIVFHAPSFCRDTMVWRLTFDEGTKVPYVATNGVIGNPGPKTAANWFKIEKAFGDFSYKIVSCFLRPAQGIDAGNEENCQQLDATQIGPNGLYFLSLVPINQNLPFFGFVFKKVATSTTTIY